MGRNHIHFACGYPDSNQVISGMRKTCDIYIEINIEKAMKDGIKFYVSKNNVILSSGLEGVIEPIYFLKVKDKNN
jgi:2'-phosphotransferase